MLPKSFIKGPVAGCSHRNLSPSQTVPKCCPQETLTRVSAQSGYKTPQVGQSLRKCNRTASREEHDPNGKKEAWRPHRIVSRTC